MPRIRQIRPEFWSDEKVIRLSVTARLTTIALLNFADDHGRGRAYPRELAGFAFPADAVDLEPVIKEIAATGIIHLYGADGLPLYHFPRWRRHQKVDKPGASRLPDPETWCLECKRQAGSDPLPDASPTPPRSLDDTSGRSTPPGNRNLESGNRNLEPTMAPASGVGFALFEKGPVEGESTPEEAPSTQATEPKFTDAFLRFWAAYPACERKTGKAPAFTAWKRAKLTSEQGSRLMAALETDKASQLWKKNGGEYICAPVVWLGKQRWLDDLCAPTNATTSTEDRPYDWSWHGKDTL